MHQRTREFLSLPYTIHVVPDECTDGSHCYLARVVELEGCESHGDTPEEASDNLREAVELYIDSMLEDGLEPPVPEGIRPVVAILRVVEGPECLGLGESVYSERRMTRLEIPA